MVSDMSSTTATVPYRLVKFRNSTDATRFLPYTRRLSRLFDFALVVLTPQAKILIASNLLLGSGECRLALLHECFAPFLVIIAGEAGLHQVVAFLQVALAFVGDHLTDDIFHRVDRQRRIARDGVGIVLDVALEFRVGQYPIDQTHHLRLGGRELPGSEENFLGEGWTDHVDEFLESVKAVAEPELGGRHAELRAFRANAHVAAKRQPDAAA